MLTDFFFSYIFSKNLIKIVLKFSDQKLLLLTFYEKPYLTAAIFELVSNERVLGEIGPDRLMPCVDPPGPP